MNCVLDASVTMRWFVGDGAPRELRYATQVLDARKSASALVPVTWGLEVANVIARAEARALVTEARSEMFLEMLDRSGHRRRRSNLSTRLDEYAADRAAISALGA